MHASLGKPPPLDKCITIKCRGELGGTFVAGQWSGTLDLPLGGLFIRGNGVPKTYMQRAKKINEDPRGGAAAINFLPLLIISPKSGIIYCLFCCWCEICTRELTVYSLIRARIINFALC